ncbi:MAG: histidinol dehydrogenase [Omnitrophica bacterium RIFCSPLOWO2_02_FULL_45_16]|nr:MAG: histidinol dehydrogenase [Omnitrophica bacterium RIFCSPLOWO2_01_FULL_45_24]OGX00020.1 MAG: histidinol dehydrogenase [Omnitrophica bacterium RIFCSPLOWO2_02_FULL_45_16]
MKLARVGSKQFQKLCERNAGSNKRVAESVRKIVENVKLYGDDAVIRYARKFDKIKLTPKELKISECETSGAYQDIKPEFVSVLKVVIDNITKFYKKQLKKSWKIKDANGVLLGEKVTPLEKVGVYVPSGTVPLVSSVYMSVIPAKMAGVKKIVLVTPPNKYKSVDPYILVVANLLKVDEIYKIGGAQAIAALAFGTKTVPKVDKIVGPGNAYVTEAKRQVFGYCDIDMLAGPTEVVIIANQFSNINYIKADLEAQGEHFMGLSILITNSKKIAKTLKKEVVNGYIILVKNMEEAADVANKLAAEHLQILTNNPKKIANRINNAGAIFLGPYTPVAIGDYVAGPSHVLPTGGSARFFSGLGVQDFYKCSHILSYTKSALENIRGPLEKIAQIEGLKKHLDSVKVRFE